jgi:hypothetical protein
VEKNKPCASKPISATLNLRKSARKKTLAQASPSVIIRRGEKNTLAQASQSSPISATLNLRKSARKKTLAQASHPC